MKLIESFPHEVEVIENVFVPMPDGTRLAARIWRPATARQKPVPAILEYIPYRKRDLTRPRDSVHAPYMAGHGYAYVRADIRGCGDSEGLIDDQYSEAELSDGVALIQWLAEQPWCNGRVGMMGLSWGGFNALQIAARQPEALGAIITVCSTDDTYTDNMHYMGGCLLGDNLSEATTMFAYQSLPPDPAVVGEAWRGMWNHRLEHCYQWLERWLEHQRRDSYWHPTSVCEDYSAIRCPVLAVSGWADGFSNAVFRLLEHLEVPRRGLIGPWSHMYPHMGIPGPAIGFLQEARRWFDHWLCGIETGVEEDPLLRVWMQDTVPPQFQAYSERPGRWVTEDAWPSRRIECRSLPLSGGDLLLDGRAPRDTHPQQIRSPLSVGLFAGKWCSYAATPDLPGDQREEDGGALVFESAPLEESLEILGMPTVELEVSADHPVAQVTARLSDVLPDGRATRVSYGLLNLTHREGHASPAPLEPGEKVRVTVRLNALAQRFPAGHRLRLSLSSSYWPLAWPAPEPAIVTVHPENSRLVLPVRAERDEDDDLRPFEPPEGAAPARPDFVRAPDEDWRVIRGLKEDTATLEVTRHDGHYRLPDVGLEVYKHTRELYSSRSNDYCTIRGETRTVRSLSRGDWHVRVETRTVLTSDSRRFHLHATLDAYEHDERVFTRTWSRDFDRDLV